MKQPKTINWPVVFARATAAVDRASKIERDPDRRRILDLAQTILLARAMNQHGERSIIYQRVADWLLLESTPDELRAIAEALDLEVEQVDGRRQNIVAAYMSALEETDPRFRWRDLLERDFPGGYVVTSIPLGFVDKIQFPPTLGQVREHFIKKFNKQLCPLRWSLEKTLVFLGLPYRVGKKRGLRGGKRRTSRKRKRG